MFHRLFDLLEELLLLPKKSGENTFSRTFPALVAAFFQRGQQPTNKMRTDKSKCEERHSANNLLGLLA